MSHKIDWNLNWQNSHSLSTRITFFILSLFKLQSFSRISPSYFDKLVNCKIHDLKSFCKETPRNYFSNDSKSLFSFAKVMTSGLTVKPDIVCELIQNLPQQKIFFPQRMGKFNSENHLDSKMNHKNLMVWNSIKIML